MFALATALLVVAAPQSRPDWPVGVEREIDEGVYMSVVASQHGWRVWKVETRNGVNCKAVKSAVGRRHPVPVGVSSMMTGGTPFLEMYWGEHNSQFSYHWQTTHYGRVSLKYRVPGARFWEEPSLARGFDPEPLNEGTIEVQLTSWEYPEILVGYAEESARFNLEGLAWAQGEVQRCDGVTPPEPAE